MQHLPDGVAIDLTLNAAYRTGDGAWVVHNVDRAGAARLSAKGVRLAYGEGIDAFLQQTYGYDVKAYGAVEVPVRVLGEGVSEHFVLPALLKCGFMRLGWGAECLVRTEPGNEVSRLRG